MYVEEAKQENARLVAPTSDAIPLLVGSRLRGWRRGSLMESGFSC